MCILYTRTYTLSHSLTGQLKLFCTYCLTSFTFFATVEFTIPDLGVLDFHMTRSPLMVPNSVQSYHRVSNRSSPYFKPSRACPVHLYLLQGVFYPIGDRTYPPFTPEPFPTGITDQRMVTLWVSAFVANSFLYAMRDKLEADITPEMVFNISLI